MKTAKLARAGGVAETISLPDEVSVKGLTEMAQEEDNKLKKGDKITIKGKRVKRSYIYKNGDIVLLSK